MKHEQNEFVQNTFNQNYSYVNSSTELKATHFRIWWPLRYVHTIHRNLFCLFNLYVARTS